MSEVTTLARIQIFSRNECVTNVNSQTIGGEIEPLCKKPWTDLYIASVRGDVQVCCWGKKVGNVAEERLLEIWNSGELQRLRKSFIEGDYSICPKVCPVLNSKAYLDPFWNSAEFDSTIDQRIAANRNECLNDLKRRSTLVHCKPRYLKFLTDNHCNLHCRHCHLDRSERLRFSPERVLVDSAEFFPSLERVRVWGGEPLFSRRSIEFLKRLGEIHSRPKIDLITNGLYLRHLYEGDLSTLRLGFVHISIDAASRQTYENIRIGGRFSFLIQQIEKLVEYRRQRADYFYIVMDMIIQPGNIYDIEDFIVLGKELGLPVKFGLFNTSYDWLADTTKKQLMGAIEKGISRAINENMVTAMASLTILQDHLYSEHIDQ